MRIRTTLAAAALALLAGASMPAMANTLRYANQGDLKSLDPYTLNETTTNAHLGHVYEGLTKRGKDLAIQPGLAERWETSEDGLTWRFYLRKNVKFHNGNPFTADDVVFTWKYASDPATAAVTLGNFATVQNVEAVDDYIVQITFSQPNPAWFDVFTGPNGMILPEHVLRDSIGAAARDAPFNLKPIGTGPFMVREFRAGDTVFYDRFPDYWDAGKPFFDSVEMKGGGDAPSAARAVVVTGEGDWAWNIQVEPEILKQMEGEGGPGATSTTPGASAERIMINFADPNQEVDGARSEPSTQHPLFQHKEARQVIALAIQRDVIAEQLGRSRNGHP